MALHYIDWMDVKAQLDPVAYDDEKIVIDSVKLRAEEAEEKFDSRFSRRFDLPFTEASEPEAFSVTQKIVSRWAAAEYIRLARQVEGTPDRLWYADLLDKQADEFVGMLQLRRQPPDATESDDPIVHIPTDGETSTSTVRDPIFEMDQITAGSSSHW